MYILAPLITGFLPLLGLPLGLWGLRGDLKHQKIYIICISLAFAALAYGYQARSETDIVRYWGMVTDYIKRDITLGDAFLNGFYGAGSDENLWLVNVFIWLASKIKDERIIPAFSTFCVYYYSLSITLTVCRECGLKRSRIIFCIIFILTALNLYSIANNVRNVMAFMMIGYATFRDVYLEKRNCGTYLLYFLPVFIHTSAIIFLIMRLLIRPIGRIKPAGILVVLALYPVLEILNLLAERMTGTVAIVGGAIMKAYRYFNDTSSEWGLEVQASGSETVFKLLYILIAVILCIMWLLTEKKKPHDLLTNLYGHNSGLRVMGNFTFYTCLLAVACTPMLRPEYWRFTATGIALSGCIYAGNQQAGIRRQAYDLVWLALAGLGVICMILWIRNITLYANAPQTLITAAYSSPFVILLKAMLNILGI